MQPPDRVDGGQLLVLCCKAGLVCSRVLEPRVNVHAVAVQPHAGLEDAVDRLVDRDVAVVAQGEGCAPRCRLWLRLRAAVFDPDDLDPATASYHEAGHVLMAHLLGGRVVGASIEHEDADWMGQTAVEWTGVDPVERARRSAMVALAGPVAEAWWRGEATVVDALTAWRADWEEVERALLCLLYTSDAADE